MRLWVGVLLLILGVPGSSAAQSGRWWRDPAVTEQLRLSPQQAAAIDREYVSTLKIRRRLRLALDSAEADLAQALAAGVLSDEEAAALAARVADAGRQRNVQRTLMLFRIYRQLSPEQRQALAALRPRQR